MAKQHQDRTTMDLFSLEKRRGRPKSNPLAREVQLKVNKRNQVKRDRAKGLRRVELKLHESLLHQLDDQAENMGITRSSLIERMLINAVTSNVSHDAV